VQLIKSLFCWQGFDNRQRFIVINITCFIAFIILNEIFINFKFGAIAMLLSCSSICLTATQRRLNDAQLHKNWLLAPAGSFLIVGLIITFIGHGSSYWLLLIPLLLALLLLTYASKEKKHYILGYNGPINLAEFEQRTQPSFRNTQRVEPTMHNASTVQAQINTRSQHLHTHNPEKVYSATLQTKQYSTDKQDNIDIGESIRLALFSHKNARITITVTSFLLILALVISMTFGRSPTTETIAEPTNETKNAKVDFLHRLALPDNFSLMVSPQSNIVINWQADTGEDQQIWDLATAKGDKSCQNIAFSKGESIRTYNVSVIDGDYYAYFSPLDTKAIIRSIAFKNTFSLCGYNFSLKGSQATLGKSAFYANLIEY